jgi:hypothetical protein
MRCLKHSLKAASLVGICLGLFIHISEVHANEARTAGLSNNPMVEDETDIVDFPGMTSAYSDFVFVNLVPPGSMLGQEGESGSANAGAFFGRKVSIGVWANRGFKWHDLEDTEELVGIPVELPTTYDLMDLYFGLKAGFGMRVSLGAGLKTEETRNLEGKVVSTGGSTFVIDMQPGYSFDVPGYHGDFGIGLTLNYFKLAQSGLATYTSSMTPSFQFRHRSVVKPRQALAGVFDLMVTRRAYTAEAPKFETSGEDRSEANLGRWALSLVVGPRLKIPGNVTICMGARLTFENLSGEVNGQEQPSLNALGIPGAVASAEILLWDTLVVRAGVDYEVYWTRVVQPEIAPIDTAAGLVELAAGSQDSGQRFNWSTGLGLVLGDFVIDATVSQQLYFDGPNFIGGQNPGFFGILSAAYMW